MRLYRLGELIPPQPPPSGAARLASSGDAGLLVDWFIAFVRDTGLHEAGDQTAAVADYLSYGRLTLWEDGGTPVSMAGLSRQVAGMARIAHVYTPAEIRDRGYGSALTSQVSRAVLAAGAAEVLLYTDLANPVSNSIYQRIGYAPVEDRIVVSWL
jgi:predicted GNAT family acetyltransferase